MNIISKNTYYKIEDDILTIAFADSQQPDPENYLILQREIDSLDNYYYEINSREYSNIGGFKRVEIYPNKLIILFHEKQKIFIEKSRQLTVYHAPNSTLNEYLNYLFEEADCEVVTKPIEPV